MTNGCNIFPCPCSDSDYQQSYQEKQTCYSPKLLWFMETSAKFMRKTAPGYVELLPSVYLLSEHLSQDLQ